MPEYVIEREMAGAGKLTPRQLKAISQASCISLNKLGPQIRWIHSYVTLDKIYCIYKSTSKEKIAEHARKNGLPITAINEIATIIAPSTAGYFIEKMEPLAI